MEHRYLFALHLVHILNRGMRCRIHTPLLIQCSCGMTLYAQSIYPSIRDINYADKAICSMTQ